LRQNNFPLKWNDEFQESTMLDWPIIFPFKKIPQI
jgi:hypothetical protein